MSGTVSSPSSSNTIAPNTIAQGSTIAQVGTTALGSLTSNFNTFLSLLMTQLQNQDPSSPMDSSQFTSELVQFSGVEQQISTNTNLGQLIQLTQASQVEQSSAMLGKPVTVNSGQLTLQNGHSQINFNTPTAEPVAIAVYNSSGAQIQTATITSNAGANTWNWDGSNANGATEPDGAYAVTVTGVGLNNATTQIPFTVTGTASAVQNTAGTVDIQMGGLTLPFSAVTSVGS